MGIMSIYELDVEDGRTRIAFDAFDTRVGICAYGDAKACARALERAFSDCRCYERLFSRTIANSDISRVNAAKGAWIDVDARTGKLVEKALAYCAASRGTFDITIGAASRLWNLKRGIIPQDEALAEAVRHVDWHGVRVEREGSRARMRLDDPAAMIDLGGIAKGWIADALDAALAQPGIPGYVIDLGGNILVRGEKPDCSPWTVGLPDPACGPGARERMKPVGTIRIAGGSVVTSGVYERARVCDGVLYHHVLDHRGGASCRVRRVRTLDRRRGVFDDASRTRNREKPRAGSRTPRGPAGLLHIVGWKRTPVTLIPRTLEMDDLILHRDLADLPTKGQELLLEVKERMVKRDACDFADFIEGEVKGIARLRCDVIP